MELTELDIKTKLLSLFNHCINDKQLHLKVDIKSMISNVFYNNSYNSFNNKKTLKKIIKFYECNDIPSTEGYDKARKQHKLYTDTTWFDNYEDIEFKDLEFNLGDLPDLKLVFIYKRVLEEKTEKGYLTKLNWFQSKEIKIVETIHTYEASYKLIHGTIEAILTADEGLELIAKYNAKNKLLIQENDINKLNARLQQYEGKKL